MGPPHLGHYRPELLIRSACVPVFAALLLLASVCAADTIRLKNGRSIYADSITERRQIGAVCRWRKHVSISKNLVDRPGVRTLRLKQLKPPAFQPAADDIHHLQCDLGQTIVSVEDRAEEGTLPMSNTLGLVRILKCSLAF